MLFAALLSTGTLATFVDTASAYEPVRRVIQAPEGEGDPDSLPHREGPWGNDFRPQGTEDAQIAVTVGENGSPAAPPSGSFSWSERFARWLLAVVQLAKGGSHGTL
jgi:hypothetical protein